MTVPAHRLLRAGLVAAVRPRDPIGRLKHRVWPRYVDLNRHMNQAAYVEIMELARWAWIVRSGLFGALWRERCNPVVGSQTIRYRRELKPLVAFTVDTRAVEVHRRALRVEQHFLVRERVHAEARVDLVLVHGGRAADRERVERVAEGLLVDPLQAPPE